MVGKSDDPQRAPRIWVRPAYEGAGEDRRAVARPAAPERALVVSTHPLLHLRRTFLGGYLSEEGGGLVASVVASARQDGGWLAGALAKAKKPRYP